MHTTDAITDDAAFAAWRGEVRVPSGHLALLDVTLLPAAFVDHLLAHDDALLIVHAPREDGDTLGVFGDEYGLTLCSDAEPDEVSAIPPEQRWAVCDG